MGARAPQSAGYSFASTSSICIADREMEGNAGASRPATSQWSKHGHL